MNRLQVGIDIHRGQLDVALTHPDGSLIDEHVAFPNSRVGFERAKQVLLKTLRAHSFDGLDIAAEATGYYWLPLYLRLFQDPDLAVYAPRQYLLNARWVHKYKDSRPPDHKDDQTDPLIIASYLRANQPRIPWKYDPKWLPMRFLTRLRFHLAQSLAREKNHLNLFIFLAFTTYTQRKVFSDALGKLSQQILTDPAWVQEVDELEVPGLQEELEKLSGGRVRDPLKKAERLYQVLHESFPLDEALGHPVALAIQVLFEIIRHLEAQIAQVEQQVEHLVESGRYPEITWLDSIPGIGPVFAAGIAAEIGDLQRFLEISVWDRKRKVYRKRTSHELVDAVAKYAGLWWPKNSSGQFEAEERRLSRQGCAYLRYYLIQAAQSMRLHMDSFAAYYNKKYQETAKHKQKRALVLTACKALDLFVALLRRKEPFQDKEASQSL